MYKVEKKLIYSEVHYGLLLLKKHKEFFKKGSPITVIDSDGNLYPTKTHLKVQGRIDGLTKLHSKFHTNINDSVLYEIDEANLNEIKISILKAENNESLEDFEDIEDTENIENLQSQKEEIIITPTLEVILEDFIVENLNTVESGLILFEEGDVKGRQYPTEVGNIDLLCLDKDKNFVIIELKKGRESDKVVGQISRYMGWVKENLAENKKVRGLIIVHKAQGQSLKDKKLLYSVKANDQIDLRFYEISLNFYKND